MWKDRRLCDLLEIVHPIIQAPMAGASTPEMAVAAANAGGMGSLGCAMQTADQVAADVQKIRQHSNRAINLNFFVHTPPRENPARAKAAQDRLEGWYKWFDAGEIPEAVETHYPFDTAMCEGGAGSAGRLVQMV